MMINDPSDRMTWRSSEAAAEIFPWRSGLDWRDVICAADRWSAAYVFLSSAAELLMKLHTSTKTLQLFTCSDLWPLLSTRRLRTGFQTKVTNTSSAAGGSVTSDTVWTTMRRGGNPVETRPAHVESSSSTFLIFVRLASKALSGI